MYDTFQAWLDKFNEYAKREIVFKTDELERAWFARCNPISCARQNDEMAKGYEQSRKCFTS